MLYYAGYWAHTLDADLSGVDTQFIPDQNWADMFIAWPDMCPTQLFVPYCIIKCSKRPVWHPSQKASCLTVNFPSYTKVQLRCWCQKNKRDVDQKSFWMFLKRWNFPKHHPRGPKTMCRLAGSPCFRIAGQWPPRVWWERARGVPFSPVRSSKQAWDGTFAAKRCTFDRGCSWERRGHRGKKTRKTFFRKTSLQVSCANLFHAGGFSWCMKNGVDVDSACDRRPGRGRWPCHL